MPVPLARRRAVERHRKRVAARSSRCRDRRPARHVRVAEAQEEVVHVVVAQPQVAVELEDLHLLLALIGVAGERLEIGRAVLLGRLFGGAFFLLRALPGGGCMPPPPGAPKPPGPICARRRAGQQQQRRRPPAPAGDDASEALTRRDPAQSSNSTPPVAAGMQEGDVVAARAWARRLVDEPHAGRLQRRRARPADPRPRSRRGGGPGPRRARKRSSAAFPRGRAELQGRIVLAAAASMQEGDVCGLRGDVLARARARGQRARSGWRAVASRSATAMAT